MRLCLKNKQKKKLAQEQIRNCVRYGPVFSIWSDSKPSSICLWVDFYMEEKSLAVLTSLWLCICCASHRVRIPAVSFSTLPQIRPPLLLLLDPCIAFLGTFCLFCFPGTLLHFEGPPSSLSFETSGPVCAASVVLGCRILLAGQAFFPERLSVGKNVGVGLGRVLWTAQVAH